MWTRNSETSGVHNTHAYRSCGGRVFAAVCLSVWFSLRYLKNWCSWDHQAWRRNVPRWVLETHLFSGQKVTDQGHESKKTLPVSQIRRGHSTCEKNCSHHDEVFVVLTPNPPPCTKSPLIILVAAKESIWLWKVGHCPPDKSSPWWGRRE